MKNTRKGGRFLALMICVGSIAYANQYGMTGKEREANLQGHIALFGKSSALGDNKDSGGTLSASLLLKQDLKYNFGVGLGAIGAIRTYNVANTRVNYTRDAFITNKAFISYENLGFDIQVGRFESEMHWLGEHVQGFRAGYSNGIIDGLNINFTYADEQAHTSREEMGDFHTFKDEYDKEGVFAMDVSYETPYFKILAYDYYFTNIFNTLGGAISGYYSNDSIKVELSGEYLVSNAFASYSEPIFEFGKTNLARVELRFDLKDLFFIGAGYNRIGNDGDFTNAYLGNHYIFEAEDENPLLYETMAPGGWHNGTNATNMFYKSTASIYAYAGVKIGKIAFTATARQSKGDNAREQGRIQDNASISARYEITKDIDIGGVLVYMYMKDKINDNNEVINLNSSYAKAYARVLF